MGTGTSTDPDPTAWRSLGALLLLAAFFVAWYAPGVFGGLVYLDEDVASYFMASRTRLYAMLHGGGFSF